MLCRLLIRSEYAIAYGYGLPDRLPANVEDMDAETYAKLRRVAEDLPEISGVRTVEIADGEITMMMSPVARHELAVLRLGRQLDTQVSKTHAGYVAFGGAELEDPGLGQLRRPDLMVFPERILEEDIKALPPDEVLLVVEVVSRTNPKTDYEDKVAAYAAMRIPHYMIVDPRDGTGIVHSLPGYRQRTKFVFGELVSVGPWKVNTSVLLTYGSRLPIADGTAPASDDGLPDAGVTAGER